MSIMNGANFKVCDSLAVPSTTTVYSNSFLMRWVENFGIWVQALSASSTPNIKIELEESFRAPTTEGSSDTAYVVPDGAAEIYSALADENAHVKSLTPVPQQYGRYKITGLAGNPSDTLLTLINFQQEMI